MTAADDKFCDIFLDVWGVGGVNFHALGAIY